MGNRHDSTSLDCRLVVGGAPLFSVSAAAGGNRFGLDLPVRESEGGVVVRCRGRKAGGPLTSVGSFGGKSRLLFLISPFIFITWEEGEVGCVADRFNEGRKEGRCATVGMKFKKKKKSVPIS